MKETLQTVGKIPTQFLSDRFYELWEICGWLIFSRGKSIFFVASWSVIYFLVYKHILASTTTVLSLYFRFPHITHKITIIPYDLYYTRPAVTFPYLNLVF